MTAPETICLMSLAMGIAAIVLIVIDYVQRERDRWDAFMSELGRIERARILRELEREVWRARL